MIKTHTYELWGESCKSLPGLYYYLELKLSLILLQIISLGVTDISVGNRNHLSYLMKNLNKDIVKKKLVRFFPRKKAAFITERVIIKMIIQGENYQY